MGAFGTTRPYTSNGTATKMEENSSPSSSSLGILSRMDCIRKPVLYRRALVQLGNSASAHCGGRPPRAARREPAAESTSRWCAPLLIEKGEVDQQFGVSENCA